AASPRSCPCRALCVPAKRLARHLTVACQESICDDKVLLGRHAMNQIAEMTEIVLGPDWNGAALTPEEFDAIEEYDENYTYELIHGVVVVNPIPLGEETGPNEFLGHLLIVYRGDHPQGNIL